MNSGRTSHGCVQLNSFFVTQTPVSVNLAAKEWDLNTDVSDLESRLHTEGSCVATV